MKTRGGTVVNPDEIRKTSDYSFLILLILSRWMSGQYFETAQTLILKILTIHDYYIPSCLKLKRRRKIP